MLVNYSRSIVEYVEFGLDFGGGGTRTVGFRRFFATKRVVPSELLPRTGSLSLLALDAQRISLKRRE